MIDKETAIALAKEADAGFGRGAMPDSVVGIDAVVRLCNLAVAHEARDLALVQNLLKEYGLQALDVVEAFKAQNDAEPVAYRLSPRYEDKEGYFDFTDSKKTADTLQARGWTITPLFTHPAHDDTALLRKALEALKQIDYDSTEDGALNQVITALRERLGEVK